MAAVRGTSVKALNIGVLGAGRHALQSHIAPMVRLGHKVRVWDPNLAATRDAALCGAYTASEEEIFAGSDGIIVCTPDRLHTESLEKAASSGIPCLVEKPAAVTKEDLENLQEILLIGLAPISTCHPRRTDPPFLWLKGILPAFAKELGPVKHIEFEFNYPQPRTGQAPMHASLLTDHFGHEIDLMEFLLGHTEQTTGRDALDAERDKQLNYRAVGERSDGVTFTFTGKRTDPMQVTYDEELSLVFADGELSLNAETGEAILKTGEGTRQLEAAPTNYEARFTAVNDDFARQILQGDEGYVSREQIWRNSFSAVMLDLEGHFTLR